MSIIHLITQSWNTRHARTLLAVIALFTVIFALFHLNGNVPTITSSIHSTIDSINSQDPERWYNALLPQGPYCKWEFSHYEPSAYEEEWFSIINEAQNHICDTISQAEHAEKSKKIVQRIEGLLRLDTKIQWSTFDTVPPAEPHPDDHLFSRMHYSRTCYNSKLDTFKPSKGRGVQLIEPLWGMLRDPFDGYCVEQRLTMPDWDNKEESQSKEAIMPQGYAPYMYDLKATTPISRQDDSKHAWRPYGIPPWHSSLTPSRDTRVGTMFEKPRNVFVDLGSSYFGGWGLTGTAAATSAASGAYFYRTYHARGNPWNRYIAVEVEPLDPVEAQKMLPADLVGIYSLINAPLSKEDGDTLNTVDLLKRIAKPGDFFVLKVDIDMSPIEMPLIQSLLDDDPANGGASGLIDEMMFEHRKYSPILTIHLNQVANIFQMLTFSLCHIPVRGGRCQWRSMGTWLTPTMYSVVYA
jgi:hypothetical protein